jgi:hypothetical protein
MLDRPLLIEPKLEKTSPMVHGRLVNRARSDSVNHAIVAPDDLADIVATELWDDSAGGGKLAKPSSRLDDALCDESSVVA